MAEYDIPRSDTLTHLSGAIYSSAVVIDSTHAIVAHRGTSSDGFIQTVSWDSDFDTLTIVDTLEHSTTDVSYNSLIEIDSTHFALAYTDAELGVDDGHIKTFSIDGSYVITQVDAFEFDTADGTYVSLVLVDSTHMAVAYTGVDGDGFIKTFVFDSGTGDNIALVDTLEHDTSGPVTHNSLVLIDATHLALAYTGTDTDGFIKTFSMGSGGSSITQIDVLEHETTLSVWTSLALIDTDGGVTHLALAYSTTGNAGVLKSFSTDSSYNNLAQIDSFTLASASARANSLVLIDTDTDGSHFVQGFLFGAAMMVETYSLDGNYNNFASVDIWEASSSTGETHKSLVKIDDSHYFLSFASAAEVGTFITIPVFPEGVGSPTTCFAGGGGPGVGSGGMW